VKKIYVGNLSFSTTEASLRDFFSRFGTVHSVAIVTDRDTGRSSNEGPKSGPSREYGRRF
jgi:RNA recognition motif-containing protein